MSDLSTDALGQTAPDSADLVGGVDGQGKLRSFRLDPSGRSVQGVTQSTPCGYEQITGITSTTVKALSGATGATWALVTAKVAGRWRDDGTSPSSTVGVPIAAGQQYRFDQVDLTAVKFILVDTLDVAYYS